MFPWSSVIGSDPSKVIQALRDKIMRYCVKLTEGRDLCWPSLRRNKGGAVVWADRTENCFTLFSRPTSASSNTTGIWNLNQLSDRRYGQCTVFHFQQVWKLWIDRWKEGQMEGILLIEFKTSNIGFVLFWIHLLKCIEDWSAKVQVCWC